MGDRLSAIPERLVAGACRGDEEALRGLVAAAYPLVRRWALVQTGDPTDADDVTQDVLVRMVKKIHSFQGDSAVESWLFTMTRNTARDRHRRTRRSRRLVDEAVARVEMRPKAAPGAHERVERGEVRDALKLFCDALPPRQREALDLVELQGLSASDAAEIMGVAAVSVRAHLFKARRTLRGRILSERPDLVEEAR